MFRDPGGPWQAEPIRLTDADIAASIRACVTTEIIPANGRVTVVDARGQNIVTVLFEAPGNTEGSCSVLRSLDGTFLSTGGSSGSGDVAPPRPGPNDVWRPVTEISGGDTINGLSAPGRTIAIGRAGANVAAIQLVVVGHPIVPSIGGGWYTAWWPSLDPVTEIQAMGANEQPIPVQ